MSWPSPAWATRSPLSGWGSRSGQPPCCRLQCRVRAWRLLICSWLQQAAGCHAEGNCLLAAHKQQELAA